MRVTFFITIFFSLLTASKDSRIKVSGLASETPRIKGTLGSLRISGMVGKGLTFEKNLGKDATISGSVKDNVHFYEDVGNSFKITGMIGSGAAFRGRIGDNVHITGLVSPGAVFSGSFGNSSSLSGMISNDVNFPDSFPDNFNFTGSIHKDPKGNVYVVSQTPFPTQATMFLMKGNGSFCQSTSIFRSGTCQSYLPEFRGSLGKSVVFEESIGKNVVFSARIGNNVVFRCKIPDGTKFTDDIPDGTVVTEIKGISGASTKNSASAPQANFPAIALLSLVILLV